MIPIKIQCGCGQKYAFDVEPTDGRIGCAVQCPVCGSDGTAATNQVIAQHLAADNVAATTKVRRSRMVHPRREMESGIPSQTVGNSIFPSAPSGALHTAALRNNARRARTNWLVPAIGGAVVLALVLVGVAFARSRGVKHDTARSGSGAQDDFPHSLAELNAWYVEPTAGQNAALFYLQGFNALQIGITSSNLPLLGKGKLPPLGAALSAPMKSALAALVQSNRDALKFFAEGAKYEQSRYPIDLTAGIDALFPHVPKLKNAALLMELSAISHAAANEGEQAANDLLIMLALARSLEAEPSLLSQLIRASAVSTAVGALEQTVNRAALPKESSAALLKAFQRMVDYEARGDGFNRAMVAERASSMALLGTPSKLLQALTVAGGHVPAEQRNQIVARLQKAGDLAEEKQYCEEGFRQLMDARKEAFPDRLKADGLIRKRVTEAESRKLAIMGLLLPGLAGRTAREAECLAHLRLGLIAVALEQFRAAHENRYPDALSELTLGYLASTPADPFDGQPLRYRRKGGGYLLYSVGPDLKDDSGARVNGKEGNILFTVITPPKMQQ